MTLVSKGISVSRARVALMGLAAALAVLWAPSDRVAGQSDLVAAWAFSEGSGTTAADESGNGNTATLNGAGWIAAGKFDAAATFDGIDDRVDVPDAPSLDLSGAITVAGWVYSDPLSQGRTMLAKEESGGIVYGLFLDVASRVELRAKISSATSTVQTSTGIHIMLLPANATRWACLQLLLGRMAVQS